MSSRCSAVLLVAPVVVVSAAPLRVCADPDNLPYSNQRGEGFENRLAEIVAGDLNAPLEYVWTPQRRGFVRNSLKAGLCDAILGLPADYPGIAATRPYYRSSYVFVTRRGAPAIASFDDPRLRTERIGLHITGNGYAPPGIALGRRGIVDHVRAYSLFDEPGPVAILDAVVRGDIDVAIVWGPLAGYCSRVLRMPVEIAPAPADSGIPLAFDISAAVRPGDEALRSELDGALERHRAAIQKLLEEYGVPRVR